MLKKHWEFFTILFAIIFIDLIRFQHGAIQQDNYLGYSLSLLHGLKDISSFDSRLFPGLPVFINISNFLVGNPVISAYLAVFSAFIGSYFILYKLTRSKLSFIPLIFPPVILNQTTQIATEIPTVFIILLSLYFFKNKRYGWALLFSGLGFWIRPIAIIPGLIMMAFLFIKDWRPAVKLLPYFLILPVLLALFNSHFFGAADTFHQFVAYQKFGVNTLAAAQIFTDIPRAYNWGWYRIFFSGLFYFLLSIFVTISSLLKFKKEQTVFGKIVLSIILASIIFIYSVNSVPFLENLGRYLVPMIPLYWLIFYDKFANNKLLYLLLPISISIVLL